MTSNLHGHIIIILHILHWYSFYSFKKSNQCYIEGFFSDDISLRNIDTRPLLLFRQIKMAPQFLFNVKWTLKMELSFVKLCFKKFLVIIKYKTYRSVLRPSVMYSPERPWLLAGRELSAVLVVPPQYGPVVLSVSVPTVSEHSQRNHGTYSAFLWSGWIYSWPICKKVKVWIHVFTFCK